MARGAVSDGQPRRPKANGQPHRGGFGDPGNVLQIQLVMERREQRSRESVSAGTPSERGARVRKDTLFGSGFSFSTKVEPTHDLEQTRVVSESELFGGSSYMPLISLQRRGHDLSLGLGAESLQGSGSCGLAGDP